MKVSVITVCYNAEATLGRTIQQVLAQTYAPLEYIVVDGASTDGTPALLRRYADRINHVVSEPDEGLYHAMNKGIALATGDWLYFANADDYLIDPEVVSDVVAFIQAYPDSDFVYGNHETRHRSGSASVYQPAPPEEMLSELVYLGNCFIQPASFFNAKLFDVLGPFHDRYKIAADYDWFVRLLAHSDLVVRHYPRTIASYAQGGASSNIRALFAEVFEIQNQVPVYQQPEWRSRRMAILQQEFTDKYARLEESHRAVVARERRIVALEKKVQALEARAGELAGEVAAMKTSKFWKLREGWFAVKQRLGLPVD
ncbi:MAG: glycosyltransferase [Elainellaceae cyanobacterium]